MTIRLARSVDEAKVLVESLLACGLCVPDEPNRVGRPKHPLIDVAYTGILAAMTGRSHRQVEEIVSPSDMVGGRIVRHGALSKYLRQPSTLEALAELVHESAACAAEEGCTALDGPADLDPLALADALRDEVGPLGPGTYGSREGNAAAVLCRACAHNMVVFGEALDLADQPGPVVGSGEPAHGGVVLW